MRLRTVLRDNMFLGLSPYAVIVNDDGEDVCEFAPPAAKLKARWWALRNGHGWLTTRRTR